MRRPSIKGSVIDQLVEDVRAVRDGSPEMAARVEARLDTESLALLDTKVNPASWYPLTTYDQLSTVLLEVEGGGDPAYIRARGEAIGRRTMEAGLYQQLEFLQRREASPDLDAYVRDMKLVVTLQGAIVSTGTWTAERDPDFPDRVVLLARDLEGYPDTLCMSTAGFMTAVANAARQTGLQWSYDRPSKGEVRYRMDRDLSDID